MPLAIDFGDVNISVAFQNKVKSRKSKVKGNRSELKTEICHSSQEIVSIIPANGERIPVWVADYVLASYGTGAIMAVPGQDQRDWDFAKTYDLPIIRTVQPPADFDGEAYLGNGLVLNSDFLNDLTTVEAKSKMIAWLDTKGHGNAKINYKLRDWLFSLTGRTARRPALAGGVRRAGRKWSPRHPRRGNLENGGCADRHFSPAPGRPRARLDSPHREKRAVTWRATLIAVVLMEAVAASLFWVFQRQLAGPSPAFHVPAEVLPALEASLEDQKRLAELDPAQEELYRTRFEELGTSVGRLRILEHNRERLEQRYNLVLVGLLAASVVLATAYLAIRHARYAPRLAAVQGALSELAAGRGPVEIADRGRCGSTH